MPIHPVNPRLKERILVMGGPGAGKTFDFYKIAEWHQKTGSDARFYAIDTDNASDRMLGTEFQHLENVEDPALCFTWDECITEMKRLQGIVRPHDWVLYDMFGPGWDMVQEKFIENIFGTDYTSFFVQARAADTGGKNGNPMDGWKDWSVINKMYREATNIVLRWPSNLYATAGITTVSAEDSKEIKAMFGRLGVRPKGQKEIGHVFHTVLWKMVNMNGWEMSTAKDRGRPLLQGDAITDFVMQYLVKCAGWKLA